MNIPIIASLNGSSLGGWTDYAREIQQAGADALELNIYYIPTDLTPHRRMRWSRPTWISCSAVQGRGDAFRSR